MKLVVTTSALVDIGGGELVWTRVYTAQQQQPTQPQQQPKQQQQPRRQQQQRGARSPPPPPPSSSAAALASLLHDANISNNDNPNLPILLLHGFPDTGELWHPLAQELAKRGHAVVVPDLPGAGLSDAAMWAGATVPAALENYTVASLARRMLALMACLYGNGRYHVVGHDFGAPIAWRMAMAAPQRVARLAALSVGHPSTMGAGGQRQRARFWYYLFIALTPPDEMEATLARDDFALLRQLIGPWSSSSAPSSPSSSTPVDAYVARFKRSPALLRAATNLYRANYRAASFGATRVPSVTEVGSAAVIGGGAGGGSRGVEAVLGIIGRHDPALTVEPMLASGAFVAAPTSWTCEVWEKSGHWIMRDEPERLAETLGRFFAAAGAGVGNGGGARARL
jgi:pimeloyl-ACP methyl ester carboxylesterase